MGVAKFTIEAIRLTLDKVNHSTKTGEGRPGPCNRFYSRVKRTPAAGRLCVRTHFTIKDYIVTGIFKCFICDPNLGSRNNLLGFPNIIEYYNYRPCGVMADGNGGTFKAARRIPPTEASKGLTARLAKKSTQGKCREPVIHSIRIPS